MTMRRKKKAANGNGNGLAASAALLRRLAENNLTITEARVAIELARRQKADEPTNLAHVAKALSMPLSTASRVAWELVSRHGLAEQKPHPKDRRIKEIVVDLRRVEQLVHV